MRLIPTFAPAFSLALQILLTASPAPSARAAALDLPVRTPGSNVRAPFYRGDVLELQLAPAAARAVTPRGARPTRAGASARLGVPAIDAVAASIGAVSFSAEFRGETPPEPGAGPDFTAFRLVSLAPGADLAAALERLRALPEVVSADPIAVLPVSQFSPLPDDSLKFDTFWLYKNVPPRTDIHAPEAWQVSTGDTSIVVAIIDTGVIPYHPDLGGRAGERGQMWINWAEKNGVPGVDDDGNGFVDDIGGWDFVNNPALVTGEHPAPGEDMVDEDNDPNDWAGHGTAVAGIVGAIAGNGIGLAGVAPRVRLMPLRIGWLDDGQIPPSGSVDMSYAAQAIRYATRMGASVMNCSWTSANLAGLGAAVTAATAAGVVLVNASGNGSTPFTYLGQRDDVIAVSATDSTDTVWPNAVKGPWVDLSAAGVGLVSTMFQRLSQTDSLAGRTPAYRGFLNGTSFAAPQVAGAVALIQARRKALGEKPLSPAGMLARLRETTDDISALNPGVTGYGTGRLNLYRALTDPPHSLAIRGGARTPDPPVVIQYNTGRSLVIYAGSDRSLVAYDGASGDTVWVRPLPAPPAGNLAAADFQAPFGALIAGATASGGVFLARDDGRLAPGWPVTTQPGLNLAAGVAIGDLDGDAVPEIVAGGSPTSGSRLWAWHLDGSLVSGFPFDVGTLGMSAPALADLDGIPGDEIVFTDATGSVRAVRHDGTELPGFPTAPLDGARAPVIARLGGPGTPPSVIVASNTSLTAFAADGSQRWSVPLAGRPSQDPALGDLNGDGVDEIIVATGNTTAIAVFDSSGAVFTGRPGWPAALLDAALGPLLVGPLAPGHGPCVAFFRTGGLVALDESAQPVPAFPKPGGAGFFGALADLDGDGATEIAAGSSPADSNVYTYDAGPGTWSAPLASWPAVRGDMARSASHANGTPPPLVIDRIRPAPVTDLEAQALGTTSLRVTYTLTGDDSLSGTARLAILRRAPYPLDASNFGTGALVPTPAPGPAGTRDTVTVTNLPEGSTWWFALRLADKEGNLSAVSNADSAALPGLPPAAITDLRVIAVAESSAVLTWTATGDDGLVGRPLGYRISASPAPLDAGNVDAAPIQFVRPALRDPGAAETLRVVRLTPGRRWRFAVRGVDHAQTTGAISNVADAVTPVGGALAGRFGMALAPRPMPATGGVIVDWQGDASGQTPQWLVIYDLAGRERRRIGLGSEPGGSYNWDGRDGESRLLPAGLYLLRLVSGARHADSRVVFIR